MLYLNDVLPTHPETTPFGDTVEIAALLDSGLPIFTARDYVDEEWDGINLGFYPDLTIRFSKRGEPRIEEREDDDLYLILVASGTALKGHVCFSVLKDQKVELICRDTCHDFDSDEPGGEMFACDYDDVIVKAKDGDVFKTTCIGTDSSWYEESFFVVAGGKVHAASLSEIDDLYESLGLEVPFSLEYDRHQGRLVISSDEWSIIGED